MNIKERLQNENLTLPSNFFSNIQHFKENLFKWNKIHNLSGARDEATMDDFIVDAVLPIAFLPPVNSLLDIGTGAGFPGLILAIALPNTQVTLVEPIAKRASFLQYNAVSMGLKNVTVVKKRVEEMEPRIFDLITSRAVTDTQMLLALSKNYRSKESILLFYKGENVYNEVDETLDYEIIKKVNRHYLLIKGAQ